MFTHFIRSISGKAMVWLPIAKAISYGLIRRKTMKAIVDADTCIDAACARIPVRQYTEWKAIRQLPLPKMCPRTRKNAPKKGLRNARLRQ